MKILGISDEVTVCELCGKSNLKRTVEIELDNGAVVHYGCDCAAKMLAKTVKGFKVGNANSIANILAYVQKWSKVYDLKIVSKGLMNNFGCCSEVRNGVLRMWTDAGVIELSKAEAN
jgi:hypothetical protein